MNRTIAAVLNFLVWGLGYLYVGERTRLGALLLAGYLPIHAYWVGVVGISAALAGPDTWLVVVGHLLLSVGLAYDAYRPERPRDTR